VDAATVRQIVTSGSNRTMRTPFGVPTAARWRRPFGDWFMLWVQ
jgi:hypothetical protein